MDFTWKGVSAASHGLVVRSLPPVVLPQRRDTAYTVPGRSGALHVQDGAWEETLKTVEIYLPYAQDATVSALDTLKTWLSGSGRLAFSHLPGREFDARLVSQLPFETWVQGYADRMASLVFQCQPFAWHTGVQSVILTQAGSLNNPGTAPAQPVITVYGSGDIGLPVRRRCACAAWTPRWAAWSSTARRWTARRAGCWPIS